MTRISRVVASGIPHHVVQRGNRRQPVFFSDDDRLLYLRLLKKYGDDADLSYWAYCLMDNHVHLVAVPRFEESLARTLGAVHWKYSVIINAREGWRGHLWQGRFFSCPLDGPYLLAAMRYVEGNPVRAGLVSRAEDYRWSSARAHVFKERDMLILECPIQSEIKNWADFLATVSPKNDDKALRRNTMTGRPVGEARFIEELERMTGRVLKESKRGPKSRIVDRKPVDQMDKSADEPELF